MLILRVTDPAPLSERGLTVHVVAVRLAGTLQVKLTTLANWLDVVMFTGTLPDWPCLTARLAALSMKSSTATVAQGSTATGYGCRHLEYAAVDESALP